MHSYCTFELLEAAVDYDAQQFRLQEGVPKVRRVVDGIVALLLLLILQLLLRLLVGLDVVGL
eukprot:6455242-Heterocapsa_arctica.AAC.1